MNKPKYMCRGDSETINQTWQEHAQAIAALPECLASLHDCYTALAASEIGDMSAYADMLEDARSALLSAGFTE